MVDVGRQDHPVDAMKLMIELCRVYKVRYLHLHMSDDQGWTFPRRSIRSLARRITGSRRQGAAGLQAGELKGAVAFGEARGVTLVPELECPATAAPTGCMPEVFGTIDPKTGRPIDIGVMNMSNEALYPVLDTLIGEMCDVFHSSPYFHIGSDECQAGHAHPRRLQGISHQARPETRGRRDRVLPQPGQRDGRQTGQKDHQVGRPRRRDVQRHRADVLGGPQPHGRGGGHQRIHRHYLPLGPRHPLAAMEHVLLQRRR